MDGITIDQFLVFTTTVDQGSFSGAARALNRAQSAITYSIQKLEDQVGTALFDRTAYRPSLTRTGKALLPRARRILSDVAEWRSQARGLSGGLEAQVRFGLAEMIPISLFVPILATFRTNFPSVSVRISTSIFSMLGALRSGALDLAVLPDIALPDSLERYHIGMIELVAVAAPNHPLASHRAVLTTDLLREELQIVLTDPGERHEGGDFGVAALDTWRVADLATKHGMLLEGIGWGSMPHPLVAADLASGRLVRLQTERWDGSDRLPRFPVVVARSRDRPLGPAGSALMAAITSKKGLLPDYR